MLTHGYRGAEKRAQALFRPFKHATADVPIFIGNERKERFGRSVPSGLFDTVIQCVNTLGCFKSN